MNTTKRMQKKIRAGSAVIALTLITAGLTREVSYKILYDTITRPYGNSISVSIPFIVLVVGTIMAKGTRLHLVNESQRDIIGFLLLGIASVLFLPINSGGTRAYLIGAVKYLQYLIVVVFLRCYSKEEYIAGLRSGFALGVILQTVVGGLYIFFGIQIPFLTGTNTGIRNDRLRMVGTFSHPGSFSLYIGIIMLFFLCEYLFDKKKFSLLYLVMAGIDLYLSGARTMLVAAAVVSWVILIRRYRNSILLKLGLILTVSLAFYWFIQSDIYQELFIENSAFDMLLVRLGHSIIGLQILFSSVINAFFGVGLNYHVDFKVLHASQFSWITGFLMRSSRYTTYEVGISVPVHNSFLVAGDELGLFGLILYIGIFVRWILSIANLLKNRKRFDQEKLGELIFCFSAACVLIIYCLQGWAMHQTHGWYLLILLRSLTGVVTRELGSKERVLTK